MEHPLSNLRNISRSLKPGAKAMFTVRNAANAIRRHTDEGWGETAGDWGRRLLSLDEMEIMAMAREE